MSIMWAGNFKGGQIMKFVLTADWHLQSGTPPCRTDNFQIAQWEKVDEVFRLAIQLQAPIIHAGDLFEKDKPAYKVFTELMIRLKNHSIPFHSVAGNHDLPNNSIASINNSAYGAMIRSGKVNNLSEYNENPGWMYGTNWGEPLPELIFDVDILVLHYLVFPGQIPKHWGLSDSITAEDLLVKYPKANIILTGHNHQSFVVDKNGIVNNFKNPYQIEFNPLRTADTILINPGSLTRHKADQADHIPCVFIYDSNAGTITKHVLKHDKNVISDEHIQVIKKRDERINQYVEALDSKDYEVGLDFKQNMQVKMAGLQLDQLTKTMIQNALAEEEIK